MTLLKVSASRLLPMNIHQWVSEKPSSFKIYFVESRTIFEFLNNKLDECNKPSG
jgi:hypothetical protein